MENFNFTIDHNKNIHITVRDCYSPCEAIAHLEELIPAEEVKRLFPVSWQFIMVDENYGRFFTMGSPQMMEELWQVECRFNEDYMHVTLKIPNQKQLEREKQICADAMKFRYQNI